MKDILIFDCNFAHCKSSSGGEPKHIRWINIVGKSIVIEDDDIVFFTDSYLSHVNNFLDRKFKKIAWLLEPPAINPLIYDEIKLNYNKFDYVLTHNIELTKLDEKIIYCPNGMCWIEPQKMEVYSKNKLFSMIASGKNMTTGHRMRNEFVKHYGNNINDKKYRIDIYGRDHNFIQSKLEGLENYHFSVAIENSQVDTYFTEKIIDCFVTGTIPIYWGTSKIKEVFDPNGIITFETIDELNSILENLTVDDYNKRIDAVKFNFEKAKEFLIAEDWMSTNLNIFE